jgi:hypothetical protein
MDSVQMRGLIGQVFWMNDTIRSYMATIYATLS